MCMSIYIYIYIWYGFDHIKWAFEPYFSPQQKVSSFFDFTSQVRVCSTIRNEGMEQITWPLHAHGFKNYILPSHKNTRSSDDPGKNVYPFSMIIQEKIVKHRSRFSWHFMAKSPHVPYPIFSQLSSGNNICVLSYVCSPMCALMCVLSWCSHDAVSLSPTTVWGLLPGQFLNWAAETRSLSHSIILLGL